MFRAAHRHGVIVAFESRGRHRQILLTDKIRKKIKESAMKSRTMLISLIETTVEHDYKSTDLFLGQYAGRVEGTCSRQLQQQKQDYRTIE